MALTSAVRSLYPRELPPVLQSVRLSIGTHTVTAIYSGDTNFATSTGTLSGGQKVHGITTITWPYKPSPCNWGQPCTFKCQLGWQGSGNPTGYVTFYDGSNSLGNCNLSDDGSASFSVGNLGIGNHNITVVYNGDDNNDGSTSGAVTQTVNKVNSTTNLTSSAGTARAGSQVIFTATVTPSSATGTVIFKDGNTIHRHCNIEQWASNIQHDQVLWSELIPSRRFIVEILIAIIALQILSARVSVGKYR